MKNTDIFKKYRRRLVIEGVLKSALWGLAAGFAVIFFSALGCWLGGYLKIWLPVVLGVATGLACGIVLYFTRFKPTVKDVARRVDGLGLEERLITMIELQNDPSFIAAKQREDANAKLSGVSSKSIKFGISALTIAVAAALFVFAAGMTTVTGLAAVGIIPSGNTLLPGASDKFIEVTYIVDEGGEISGEAEQLVLPGEDAEPVLAVAEDGWIFMGWDDGIAAPYRSDKGISEPLIVTAMFERVDDADEDPELNGPGGEGDDEEAPGNDGQGEGDGSGEGESGSSDGGSSGEGEGSGEGGEEGEGDGKGQGNGAGGRYEEQNQIIDGETYYRDEYDQYYQRIKELLESGEELSDEEREFIEKYLGSL